MYRCSRVIRHDLGGRGWLRAGGGDGERLGRVLLVRLGGGAAPALARPAPRPAARLPARRAPRSSESPLHAYNTPAFTQNESLRKKSLWGTRYVSGHVNICPAAEIDPAPLTYQPSTSPRRYRARQWDIPTGLPSSIYGTNIRACKSYVSIPRKINKALNDVTSCLELCF